MPVIKRVKNIDRDWIDQEAQHIIDEIDHALTCCWGMEDVYRYTVEAIMNYNEYKLCRDRWRIQPRARASYNR